MVLVPPEMLRLVPMALLPAGAAKLSPPASWPEPMVPVPSSWPEPPGKEPVDDVAVSPRAPLPNICPLSEGPKSGAVGAPWQAASAAARTSEKVRIRMDHLVAEPGGNARRCGGSAYKLSRGMCDG